MKTLAFILTTFLLTISPLMSPIPASAATFVYVSNAEDGTISTYRMNDDGALEQGPRAEAAKLVMPMAVSPDKRFLYAASRAKPYRIHVYAIDPSTGSLSPHAESPLFESFPFISLDKTGRFLFGASYTAHLMTVNRIDADGKVADKPTQIVPLGRHAHSIRIDSSNRYLFVPTLGTDEIFELVFDAQSGTVRSNTPAVALMKPGTGPRHFVFSPDNRNLYVLSELLATVTTYALDQQTGLLSELATVGGLPAESKLQPGAPRTPIGAGGGAPMRNTDNDIWCADIQITPNDRFLYISERTSSVLSAFKIDPQNGALIYLASTPTEKQPRGFAIDPSGRYLIASGEKSETISVYAIAQGTGTLEELHKYPVGRGANWIEIVRFD